MADVRLNLLVVALCFVELYSVDASTCNFHSGIEYYTCTKYSQVKYSQAYQCGFWHWNRCYRTKYSHTAHQSTCTRNCKVNGAWASWQAWGGWSTCDKTCGDGQRILYSVRQCSNPTPKNGGEYCNGTNVQKETEECLLKLMAVGVSLVLGVSSHSVPKRADGEQKLDTDTENATTPNRKMVGASGIFHPLRNSSLQHQFV